MTDKEEGVPTKRLNMVDWDAVLDGFEYRVHSLGDYIDLSNWLERCVEKGEITQERFDDIEEKMWAKVPKES